MVYNEYILFVKILYVVYGILMLMNNVAIVLKRAQTLTSFGNLKTSSLFFFFFLEQRK